MAVTQVVAWVGAVTGVASLCHNMWQGHTNRSDDKRRRNAEASAKARDHALAVHIALNQWGEKWDRVDTMLRDVQFGEAMAIRAVTDFDFFLEMPVGIFERKDRMSEFGIASRSMQSLIYEHNLFTAERKRLSDFANGNFHVLGQGAGIEEEKAYLVSRLAAMVVAMKKARSDVDHLLSN